MQTLSWLTAAVIFLCIPLLGGLVFLILMTLAIFLFYSEQKWEEKDE